MIETKELDGRFLDVSNILIKQLDVSYGPHVRHKLDIYYPKKVKKRLPCIFFVHGGAFIKGDKRRYQLKGALQAIEKGYVVVSINYRLLPEYTYPSWFEDINAAIRYIDYYADELYIDKENYIVWGESAGALLTMVNALEQTQRFVNRKINNYPNQYKIKIIIDQYGPTDLIKENNEKMDIREHQFHMKGVELINTLISVSPVSLVHKNAPYLIIQHGLDDKIVMPQQSRFLYETYKKYHIAEKVYMYMYEGLQHNPEQFFEKTDDIFKSILKINEKIKK